MRRHKSRKFWRGAGVSAAVALVAVLLVARFCGFAEGIATARAPQDPRADAIVVLTGESGRIEEALKLLEQGRATRLLISGVNPSVTSSELASLVSGDLRDEFACCVDLGRRAVDTVGNATETRDWAVANGFTSLIVVTSDYHMPRSMTELRGAMPTVTLIPFPVSSPNLRFPDWWRDPATVTWLLREYGKYLIAKARQLLPTGYGPHSTG